MVDSILLKPQFNPIIRLVVTKEGRRGDIPERQMYRVVLCCEVHAHSVSRPKTAMVEGKLKANTSAPF